MIEPLVTGSVAPIVERFDAVLFDLDGVLYVGAQAVPGAAEAVAAVRRAGCRVGFVTNNASRPPAAVARHLRTLGIEADSTDVVTSAQAAARLVCELVPPGSPVLVVGGDGLNQALEERGLVPVRSLDDHPLAVVQGFAPEVGWRMLTEGTAAVRSGIPWVATNLDVTVPSGRGLAPGNGALVDVIATATGRRPVAVAGKPQIPLHLETVDRLGATSPVVVGDRLDTDIEGANRAGTPSLLVLTGVTTPRELLAATREQRPTWVAEDLASGLLEPHDPVMRVGSRRWVCGSAEAVRIDDRIELSERGSRVEALRVACAAVWDGPAGWHLVDPSLRLGSSPSTNVEQADTGTGSDPGSSA